MLRLAAPAHQYRSGPLWIQLGHRRIELLGIHNVLVIQHQQDIALPQAGSLGRAVGIFDNHAAGHAGLKPALNQTNSVARG